MSPDETPMLASIAMQTEDGATGVIVHPDGAAQLKAEIGTFALTMPSRQQRRAIARMTGPAKQLISPTAAKRRKARRGIARRSQARNRAR